jgi:hypothetical protein
MGDWSVRVLEDIGLYNLTRQYRQGVRQVPSLLAIAAQKYFAEFPKWKPKGQSQIIDNSHCLALDLIDNDLDHLHTVTIVRLSREYPTLAGNYHQSRLFFGDLLELWWDQLTKAEPALWLPKARAVAYTYDYIYESAWPFEDVTVRSIDNKVVLRYRVDSHFESCRITFYASTRDYCSGGNPKIAFCHIITK